MRIERVAGLALLAVTIGPAPSAASAKVTQLEPSTAWNIDYAPSKCRLARAFGDGEDRHILFFEQYWPSDEVGLTVAGPSFDRFKSRKRTSLWFHDAQEPMRTEPFAGELESIGSAVIYSAIDPQKGEPDRRNDRKEEDLSFAQLDTQWAKKTSFVALKQGSKHVVLRTGPISDAFEALSRCSRSLLADWGLDVDKHLNAASLPEWLNENKIVKQIQRSYPLGALRRGEQVIIRLRAMVDETGSVTECIINEATVAPQFDSPACKAMLKAQFAPALDAEGQPFKSYYTTSVTYRIGS